MMLKWEPGERIVDEYTACADNKKYRNEWEVVARGRIKVIECDPHFGSYEELQSVSRRYSIWKLS